ncbi:MAG: hypothetical protein EBX81_01740 [bacterium]|nr:hypothetical protein [Candidatus Aquidulcis sp.]
MRRWWPLRSCRSFWKRQAAIRSPRLKRTLPPCARGPQRRAPPHPRVKNDSVAAIFEREGEEGFRLRERRLIASLVAPEPPAGSIGAELGIGRVVALGGGAAADPRNRWALRNRAILFWLDAPDTSIARRLRTARVVRPLMNHADPLATLERLRGERERFYRPGLHLRSTRSPGSLADEAIALLRTSARPVRPLVDAETLSGRWLVGDGIAVDALRALLAERGLARMVLATEPNAARAVANGLGSSLTAAGITVIPLELPSGEAAKELHEIGAAAQRLANAGVERRDLIVRLPCLARPASLRCLKRRPNELLLVIQRCTTTAR